MPFQKKEGTKKFYTGLNQLKNNWRKVVDHIDSTPAQITFANMQLDYLCAETPSEQNLKKLALVAQYGARLGYRVELKTGEPTELDNIVEDMLKFVRKDVPSGV